MELAAMTLYKTVVMAVLALVGVFCYHQKMIDEELNKKLSDLVLMVFTPILLFTSFQTEYDRSLLKGLFVATVLSLVSFAVIWGISKLVIRGQDPDTACVEHIALMYSNCGFIGIPMAQGLFGSEGVMYMTAYVAAANFLLWSHGVIVMSGKADRRSVKKVFTSPTILAIVAGVLCFLFQIQIPEMAEEPLEMIAGMNTPMAMIVAGVNIAQTDLLQCLKRWRLYWLCAVRLLVMPAVLVGIFLLFPGQSMVKTIMVLASACPAGVTGSLFAVRYGKDAGYASELFALSTVLSVATVPLMMLLCG